MSHSKCRTFKYSWGHLKSNEYATSRILLRVRKIVPSETVEWSYCSLQINVTKKAVRKKRSVCEQTERSVRISCPSQGSNPRPPDYKSGALPSELLGRTTDYIGKAPHGQCFGWTREDADPHHMKRRPFGNNRRCKFWRTGIIRRVFRSPFRYFPTAIGPFWHSVLISSAA